MLTECGSLDRETDTKVQNVIRESFRGCTVIMIAHRLRTLLDFDQVVVLNDGRVVEQGNPGELIGRKDGEFSKLLAHES